jgi:ATP-dependent DNA helicase HFM1/MER3
LEKPRKPRKPRKRATSNHKAGNLNQTTLSPAFAKQDKPEDARKRKQPAKELTKMTAARKEEHSSQSRLPKLPLKNPASTQGQNGSKGKISRSALTTKGGKSIEQPAMVSSDFDDDGFDDLPPLSYIMQGSGSCIGPADPETHQEKFSVLNNSSAKVEQTLAQNQPDEPQLLQIPNPRDIIEISDESTPETGQDIFTQPEEIRSSVATATLPDPSSITINPPTRKSSSVCRAYEARFLERAERSPSPRRLLPAINTRHTLTQLEPISAVDLTSKVHAHRTPTNSSSGWDDVDRLLLEEFKDVINHY